MSDSSYLLADDDDYTRALDELTGAEGVLIYCGAGLSYPLTGLTWNRLILDVFENLRSELENNIVEFTESADVYDKVRERLSASSSTPRENATIVATYIESLAKASYGGFDYYDKLTEMSTLPSPWLSTRQTERQHHESFGSALCVFSSSTPLLAYRTQISSSSLSNSTPQYTVCAPKAIDLQHANWYM